ncbi:hypothetical protein BKA62DRAFT_774052 [Auriculariales sp. MPI-PUGE-AT-0066]|nr:hypothetical protein BKA62DRAFT_774052 [Auriculariales sp. MPI-PUGE-AT-0066]
MRAPFVLAATSREWRVIALRTGSLWTYIGIPSLMYNTYFGPKAPRMMGTVILFRNFVRRWFRTIRLILDRSRGAPLEVYLPKFTLQPRVPLMTLWTRWRGGREGFNFHRQTLKELSMHLHHIRSINMAFTSTPLAVWECLQSAAKLKSGTLEAPMLEQLVIENCQSNTEVPVTGMRPPDQTLDAPNLRICILPRGSETFILRPTSVESPTQFALTRLEIYIDSTTYSYILPVLKACAGILKQLVLSPSYVGPPSAVQGQTIVLKSLQTFSLDACRISHIDVANLMKTLTVPCIRSAEFTFGPTEEALLSPPPPGINRRTTARAALQAFLKALPTTSTEVISLSIGYNMALSVDHARTLLINFPILRNVTISHPTRIDPGFLGLIGQHVVYGLGGVPRNLRVHLSGVTVMLPSNGSFADLVREGGGNLYVYVHDPQERDWNSFIPEVMWWHDVGDAWVEWTDQRLSYF